MQPHTTLRRDRHDPEVRTPVQPAVEDGQRSMTGRRLVCAACGHPITTERQRIEVNGRHQRRCVNPDGVLFHIGCFRHAPGCVSQGVPITAFTWFPGFAWNYALCALCSTLLGWRYQSIDVSTFFGLILNRLTTAHERPH